MDSLRDRRRALTDHFGDYEIERRLGVGGMAETFVAVRRDGEFEQRVCLKRVLPVHSQDPQFVRLFRREARLAAGLRHSNLTSVVDFGDVNGTLYMALELVDGVDLEALLKFQPHRALACEVAMLVAFELATALDYAHHARRDGEKIGVVHRDLSPANVLVSRHGEIKLADFGVAKAMSSAGATASNTLVGKMSYLAPEQMRGHAVDGRADLYSLGVILFEMLSGVRPFGGADDIAILSNVLKGERRAFVPRGDVSPSVRATVERLLEHDVTRRLSTAAELADRLGPEVAIHRARQALASLVGEVLGSGGERELAASDPTHREMLSQRTTRPGRRAPAVMLLRESEKPTREVTIDPSRMPTHEVAIAPSQIPTRRVPIETLQLAAEDPSEQAPTTHYKTISPRRTRVGIALAVMALLVVVGIAAWMAMDEVAIPIEAVRPVRVEALR